jgi:glycerol-3-phosphate acyltransferase PlsY
MVIDILFIVFGYLLGSISTAIIVCRLLKLPDPRTEGSHNPGATNVLRIGGKKAAAATLFGDLLKGFTPVALAGLAGASEWGIGGTALAAFLGHLFPVFFGFQGGKGVATACGAILALSVSVALLAVVTWFSMTLVARVSSLSALTAAILTPFYMWWFELPDSYLAAGVIMVAFLIWRHRSNIRRILDGTESRISAGKKS